MRMPFFLRNPISKLHTPVGRFLSSWSGRFLLSMKRRLIVCSGILQVASNVSQKSAAFARRAAMCAGSIEPSTRPWKSTTEAYSPPALPGESCVFAQRCRIIQLFHNGRQFMQCFGRIKALHSQIADWQEKIYLVGWGDFYLHRLFYRLIFDKSILQVYTLFKIWKYKRF